MSIKLSSNCPKFQIPLNDEYTLETELEAFTHACNLYDRIQRRKTFIKHRKSKRRYYKLGLMARMEKDTTDEQITSLLMSGVRTFYFDTYIHKPEDLNQMLVRTKNEIDNFQQKDTTTRLVTGIALSMNGDNCRLGRMRNNCTDHLKRGEVVSLTFDERYKYSCYKEIAFVANLAYYIKNLHLKDEIKIGPLIVGHVVKTLSETIAVSVDVAGPMQSYADVELPTEAYALNDEEIPYMFAEDLGTAINAHANYIVVPKIRAKAYLMSLRSYFPTECEIKIIGVLDLEFVREKMVDLRGILRLLDYLWIPDLFIISYTLQRFIFDEVMPICKTIRKPIIGTVHIERRIDFNNFENHYFLWKLDAIFMEKSTHCNKYPLIVKKLLPLRDYRKIVIDKCSIVKDILTSYDTIVNFIIRTICSVECQAIFINAKCESSALALGRVEIYCPAYVIFNIDENNTVDLNEKYNLARTLHLRRNLYPLLYTNEMNTCNFSAVEYGIDFARKKDLVHTGDFVITIEIAKLEDMDAEFEEGDDAIILRATYLPPIKKYDMFKFA